LAFWVPETLETGMTPIPPSNLTKRVVPLGREMNERDQRRCERPCLRMILRGGCRKNRA
jgi:hypothetical protein